MENLYNIVRLNAEIDENDDINLRMPKRYIRDMQNPVQFYNDFEFKRRYRFSKNVVMEHLIKLVEPELLKVNQRGLPVSPLIAVLCTLRFYASGSFQLTCGDLGGISQSTVSRIVKQISTIFAAQSRNSIKMPTTHAEEQHIYEQFYQIAHFPEVVGCIDCTHIPIKNPGGLVAELYRNRKRTFSINVQVVAGPSMKIMDIVARWPGREHDSMIFNNSSLKARFEAGHLHGYLLGDSGYPCLPYLMTPLLHPENDSEILYNSSQIRTRNVVERLFGVWKRRFPCLAKGLGTKLETTCVIVVACAVLYNIGIDFGENLDEVLVEERDANIPENLQVRGNAQGYGVRRALIARHFTE
ncbi:putative nuclease HARBI1 [Cylas formicarius]|uniref:putative nuclease HARBI1 n=1 Tax=Cylas formicarius TaxID=197179 RepID=UPI0029587A45|nr:putative nuclease HARBI1 [Cylas formicarius]